MHCPVFLLFIRVVIYVVNSWNMARAVMEAHANTFIQRKGLIFVSASHFV